MRRISDEERRARLARRHRLLPERRTDDVARITEDLVALHSSDPVTVYLSVLARMRRPALATVDRALYDDRAVIRHHAMRRTLWVAGPDVLRLMHAAATRKLAAAEHRRTARMLEENGVPDPEAWLTEAKRKVVATLHEHGPMTARALGRRVPALRHKIVLAPGKRYSATVSAHTRVLLGLGFEGALVRTRPTGTWVNGEYTWAAMDDWVPGGVGDLDEREAACALADRWLRVFGPGTTGDLQWWTGWTVRLTRQALEGCGAVPVTLAAGEGWVAAGDADPEPPAAPWVGLLPGLDPTTMGWKQRDWYLPAEAADAFDGYGNAGPTIWADGRVVGAWAQRPDGEIRTHFFVEVGVEQRRAVAARAAELAGWLGETRFTVRFPGRIHAKLLG
jgi:hypothetical protein